MNIFDVGVCIVSVPLPLAKICPQGFPKYVYAINWCHCFFQGYMDHNHDILGYLNMKRRTSQQEGVFVRAV